MFKHYKRLKIDAQTQLLLPVILPEYYYYYCIKCLCLGVSGLCLGMSGWGLRVSGDVFIPNKLAQIYIVHVSSDINFSSSAC